MNMALKSSPLAQSLIAKTDTPQSSDPMELIPWSLKQFSGQNLVITTAFGMEGCALVDMYSRFASSLTVAYIDTGFFFPETRKLIDRMSERYSHVEFKKWKSPISVQQQKEEFGDGLWKKDPNLCCKIRKVVPMKQNLKNYDVWVTGIRKTQTQQRAGTPKQNVACTIKASYADHFFEPLVESVLLACFA